MNDDWTFLRHSVQRMETAKAWNWLIPHRGPTRNEDVLAQSPDRAKGADRERHRACNPVCNASPVLISSLPNLFKVSVSPTNPSHRPPTPHPAPCMDRLMPFPIDLPSPSRKSRCYFLCINVHRLLNIPPEKAEDFSFSVFTEPNTDSSYQKVLECSSPLLPLLVLCPLPFHLLPGLRSILAGCCWPCAVSLTHLFSIQWQRLLSTVHMASPVSQHPFPP